jgi:hypothetical protein
MNDNTATAYIRNGRLCIVGLSESDMGPIPFTHTVEVGADVEDGPVDIGAEEQEPRIASAIVKAREPMLAKIEEEKMRATAEQWVERARAGDQNAMALIQGVRRAVQAGNERAKRAMKMLVEYIKTHPVNMTDTLGPKYLPAHGEQPAEAHIVRKLSQFVGDEAVVGAWTPPVAKADPYMAVLILADGPRMTPERVKKIAAHFGAEEQPAFWRGFQACDDKGPTDINSLATGRAVGRARNLQGVRAGAFPIARICKIAAWEMGD